MTLIRVLQTAPATLTRQVFVDETLVDASAGMSVSVHRLDGTLVTGPTAASNPSTGVYQYVFPGHADLDHLDVTWTGIVSGATVILTDRVEVVGGHFFGIAEARGSDSSLSDPVRYTTAMLANTRIQVEQECERICGWAFVPRFERRTFPGTGSNTIFIPVAKLRALRSISTQRWPEAPEVTTLLDDVSVDPGGQIVRHDGGIFPYGNANIVLEYEHGHDYPPEDLKEKAMYRLRSLLNLSRIGIPDRVSSYSTPDGATYRITLPSRGHTGIPEVDAVYCRYEAPPIGFA